ncbi:RteC domain-containing protein [Christiangramia portivictoriae]|uniref:RteC domain-containing protein n=1 Tax=Christiangramia portivictoriae TaxID=326069 RepID=UPI0012FC56CD|nr:RteC domain-containing protein [Christiangramia portivictoriae]
MKQFESEQPTLKSHSPPSQGDPFEGLKHFMFEFTLFENNSTYYENLQDTFAIEYKWLVSDNIYFYCCPLKIYKKHYNSLKKEFLENFIDADEIDFILKEINDLNGYTKMFLFYQYLNSQHKSKIYYSVKKNIIFLKEKLPQDVIDSELAHIQIDKSQAQLGRNLYTQTRKESNNDSHTTGYKDLPFQIDLSEIDLTEIIKSLIQAKVIHSYKSEKEVFQHFSKALNLKVDKREKLQTIKGRTIDKTPFLNRLTIALENWINN